MGKIKQGDEVIVLTGKDKGKRGKVTSVITERDRVVVRLIAGGLHRAAVDFGGAQAVRFDGAQTGRLGPRNRAGADRAA